MDPDWPRRIASSPQLARAGRARSSSASSSASLTATEDNYRRQLHRTPVASSSTSQLNPAYPAAAWALDDAVDLGSSGAEDSLSEDTQELDEHIYFSRAQPSSFSNAHSALRYRRGLGRRRDADHPRMVTTARGQPCAGETETELDEMPIRLPTSRKINSRPVIVLPIDFFVALLFQIFRLLAVIPATLGVLYNVYHIIHPFEGASPLEAIDRVMCALWALLTGFQCLALTTGLMSRWKAYYTTPSTLIRLVALQGICWPATHFTLLIFDHSRRPLACWALIGTTTCLSRSVQLWVTSNLYYARARSAANLADSKVLREEGRLGPRRWDWVEVMVKCAVPAGILYFFTAWALLFKAELGMRHSL